MLLLCGLSLGLNVALVLSVYLLIKGLVVLPTKQTRREPTKFPRPESPAAPQNEAELRDAVGRALAAQGKLPAEVQRELASAYPGEKFELVE